jgi:hypothetical protein
VQALAAGLGAVVVAALQLLRGVAPGVNAATARSRRASALVAAFTLAVVWLILLVIDATVHAVFNHNSAMGKWLTIAALLLSLIVGRAVDLVNLSSFFPTRAARIARTFLGASNPERIYPAGFGHPAPVDLRTWMMTSPLTNTIRNGAAGHCTSSTFM